MTSSAVTPPTRTALTVIPCVLRMRAPALLSLDHVVQLLDAFMDMPTVSSLPKAAANGSLRWFNRVYDRTIGNSHGIESSEDDVPGEYFLSNAMTAAVERGHLALVEKIHSLHPKRLDVRLLPIAAKKGNLEMFQWLFTHRTDDLCVPDDPCSATAAAVLSTQTVALRSCCLDPSYIPAIAHDQLHIIQWLYANGFRPSFRWPLYAGDHAAACGDLEKVQRFHREEAVPYCFSERAIDLAAKQGHHHVVQYLLTNRSEGFTAQAVHYAVLGGYDDIHELLRGSGIVSGDAFENLSGWASDAAKHGRLDLIQDDRRYSESDKQSVLDSAMDHGHLHVVQWVCQNHQPVQLDAWRAAMNGHLHILQWLHDHQEEPTNTNWADAMDQAAGAGHLAVVEWLHENRTEGCTAKAMDVAAGKGHLEVVQWLHLHRTEGCTVKAMADAAKNGHLEVVIWLHENRHEGCARVDSTRLSVLKWLHWNRHDRSWTTTRVMDRAASKGDLATLQFLHDHRTEGCTANAATHAASKGHLYIVQWFHKNYPDVVDVQGMFTKARDNGHRHIVHWLTDQQPIPMNQAPPTLVPQVGTACTMLPHVA